MGQFAIVISLLPIFNWPGRSLSTHMTGYIQLISTETGKNNLALRPEKKGDYGWY